MLAPEQVLFTGMGIAYKRANKVGIAHARAGRRRSRTNMTDSKRDADVAFIKALAEMLRSNDLTELEVKREYGDQGRLNVRVSRAVAAPVMVAAAAPPPVMAPAGAPAPASAPLPADTGGDPASHPGAVTSPMVGTVYMQAEPESPKFITLGAPVSEGDTLLIVEAMKTMNHIHAPKSGVIKRILVEDGAAVEFGTPLVIIE